MNHNNPHEKEEATSKSQHQQRPNLYQLEVGISGGDIKGGGGSSGGNGNAGGSGSGSGRGAELDPLSVTTPFDETSGPHPTFEVKEPRRRGRPMGWIIIQRKNGEPYAPSYSVNRLVEVFTQSGFDMEIVNAFNVDVYLTDDDRKSVLVDGKVRRLPTFVLARTGAKTDFYTLAVYRHLEKLDVPVINASQGIEDVKDKLFSLQILAQNNIAVPKTILLRFPVNVKYVTKRLGVPIIIKLLSGMQGLGVFMAKTETELQTYCDMLEAVSPDARMIFQECITTSLGRDLRVLVVGGKVIGAMKRCNDKDFRANIHRGAEGILYKLPRTAEYLALSATRVLNLDIAGVDLLFDDEQGTKFRVCEVNSSPGFEGFEKATKANVSEHLISYVCLKCNISPEVLVTSKSAEDTFEKKAEENNKFEHNIEQQQSQSSQLSQLSQLSQPSQSQPQRSQSADKNEQPSKEKEKLANNKQENDTSCELEIID